ncbi:MAG: resolvase, partial [Sedimentitalea sp.]
VLKSLQPAESFFELAKAMMRDAWDKRFVIAQGEKTALKNQLDDLNRQIESLLDRIVETSNSSVVSAYEDKIDKLERDKIVLREKLDSAVPEKGRFEDCMELALRFLSSPWKIYKNGDFAMRQTVLRLAFAEPIRYCQNGMYGTPELSFPFKCLGDISGSKSEMVL